MRHLAPIAKVPRTVDAVLQRLRSGVVNGPYVVGEHLPPERELAQKFGVSRLTLRAAIARLEQEGLVEARQGAGVVVLDSMKTAGLSVLTAFDLTDRPDFLKSFLELRRAVSVEAVAWACERAVESDIGTLQELAALQVRETDTQRYIERDFEFARAVLVAGEAFSTMLLLNTLIPIARANPTLSEALVEDRVQSLAGYTLTISVLTAKDAELARTVLRKALEAADAEVMKAIARRRRSKRGGR